MDGMRRAAFPCDETPGWSWAPSSLNACPCHQPPRATALRGGSWGDLCPTLNSASGRVGPCVYPATEPLEGTPLPENTGLGAPRQAAQGAAVTSVTKRDLRGERPRPRPWVALVESGPLPGSPLPQAAVHRHLLSPASKWLVPQVLHKYYRIIRNGL